MRQNDPLGAGRARPRDARRDPQAECELVGDDIGGLAVHIAARLCTLAEVGEILVSGTARDIMVGSSIELSERGEHELKGVPGRWAIYGA